MRNKGTIYTIKVNHSRKTYTIRRYDDGKLTSKYRSDRQTEIFEDWTENDIKNYLHYNTGDYYRVY